MARILVIDDDRFVTTSLGVYLEPHGHTVVAADCGRSALKALAADTFDIVISDVFMPDMDGFEILRVIQEHDPAIPVIVMSGFTFPSSSTPAPDFLAMATQLGAACGLRKPFRPSEILAAVDACLARRRGAANAPRAPHMAG
jgi:DNA-binding NtrC family response regulator